MPMIMRLRLGVRWAVEFGMFVVMLRTVVRVGVSSGLMVWRRLAGPMTVRM
jgi:hypothetical protein